MTSSKLGLLGVCAVVLGVMAIFASSAQAGLSWLVLNAAETVNTEVKTEGGAVNLLAAVAGEIESANLTLLTRLVGLAVAVNCTSFSTTNFNLEPEGKFSTGKFTLTGCTVKENNEPTLCTVKTSGALNGVIETTNLKSELVSHNAGEKVLIKIEGEGGSFGTLRFWRRMCLARN